MLRNYLLIAWKVLLRRKFFTFISLVGISLTLATLLVVTAFVDNIAHPPLPFLKTDRMLFVQTMMAKGGDNVMITNAGYGFHDKYVRHLPDIEAMTVLGSEIIDAYPGGQKVRMNVSYTEATFWHIMDFEFIEGGGFTEEDVVNVRNVAVISEETRTRFFGNTSALGKMLPIDGKSFRVVGVVKNVSATSFVYSAIWFPITIDFVPEARSEIVQGVGGGYRSIILAKSVNDIPRIKNNFQTMLSRVQIPTPPFTKMYGGATSILESHAMELLSMSDEDEDFGTRNSLALMIGVLVAGALAFMLLPAINLVNLNVSRILERASEIGVRKAFGASRRALVGQFVVENCILTVIGGAIGILLAELFFLWFAWIDFVPHTTFHINYRVVVYAIIMSLVFGLLSGVLPAWKMSRLPIVSSLKGGINV